MQGYKVCLLSDTYPPDVGGLAISTERNARLLAQAGHEVHVCVPGASLPPGEVRKTAENGVEVHRLGPQKKMHDTLTDWFELVTGLAAELSFDLLHGFFAAYAGYPGCLRRPLSGRSVGGQRARQRPGQARLRPGPGSFHPVRLGTGRRCDGRHPRICGTRCWPW